MRIVLENLWIGNQVDYEAGVFDSNEFSIVLAAKEPWHRQALGYTGRSAAKDHPEYLMAIRDNNLILNLVDAPKAEFFDKGLIDIALNFIKEQHNLGKKTVIVCNKGESRSASLALLYLVRWKYIDVDTLEEAEAEFLKLYPEYNPGSGIRGFVKENWNAYNAQF